MMGWGRDVDPRIGIRVFILSKTSGCQDVMGMMGRALVITDDGGELKSSE
jgi:hypothetical protein